MHLSELHPFLIWGDSSLSQFAESELFCQRIFGNAIMSGMVLFFTSVAPSILSAWLVASHLTSSHIIIETTCSLVRLALAQQPLSEANIIFHYIPDNRTG